MSAAPAPRASGAAETALAVVLLTIAAVAPFVHALDLAVAPHLETIRTCAGHRVFVAISDWTRPVGFGVVLAAVASRLLVGPATRWRGVPESLATLLVGVLLIEAIKRAVDRPRPGAESLTSAGAAFPSGHVGNAVLCALVVVCLWRGGVERRFGAGWLLAIAAAVVVGMARVYTQHHWTSDVVGTAALVSGFALLALAHPRPGVRRATLVATGLVTAALFAATARGWHVEVDGGIPLVRPPLAQVDFTAALAGDRLRGVWRPEAPGDVRRGVWLWSPTGALALDPVAGPVGDLRLVLWPRSNDRGDACARLRVELNGALLGERLLHAGWRAYVFPVAGHWREEENVLAVSVVPIGGATEAAPPFAAFRELTLHAPWPDGRSLRRGS